MRYRDFGKTGWKVSEVGFGAWAIGGTSWGPQKDEESLAALARALDLEVTFIDTAQGYGDGHSEKLVGQALRDRKLPVGGGPVRVLTKIPPLPGTWPASPYDECADRYPAAYLRERVERSLRDLGAETLDVVLLHLWSRRWNRNPEALHVLRELKREGKVQAIGISNSEFDEHAVCEPLSAGLVDAVETVYNIFNQNPAAELLPLALIHGVAIIARSPFDEGSLTGKLSESTVFVEGDVRRTYFHGDRLKKTVERVEAIRKTVEELSGGAEKDLASVALRFALRTPGVTVVIPGIRSVRQAEANAAVSKAPALSDELYKALQKHYWYKNFWLD